MKIKSDSKIRSVLKKMINIPAWFDWERTKSVTLYVTSALRRLFIIDVEDAVKEKEAAQTESFETAQKKMNLTDAELVGRQRALLRLSLLMVLISGLIFSYSIYHFINAHFKAGMISLVVMMIAVTLAFRYHFWYFQIKNRKLGCTIQEWFRKGLLGEKK